MDFPRLYKQNLDEKKAIKVLQRICFFAVTSPSAAYSILYYADRECASYTMRTLFGETYLAYHHGAVPSWFNHLFMSMLMPSRDRNVYLQMRSLFVITESTWMLNKDMTQKGDGALSQFEQNCLDSAIFWYKRAQPREVLISRRDESWQKTEHGKEIGLPLLLANGNKPIRETAEIPPEKALRFERQAEGKLKSAEARWSELPSVSQDPQEIEAASLRLG